MEKKDIHNLGSDGICKYIYPEINGIPQYIQIRGENKNNPILLVIHGGPGGSIAGICHTFQLEWEKYFTVVNWDQRNSGKTYFANIENAECIAQNASIEQYTEDLKSVINFINSEIPNKKIILLGISWGTVIASEFIKKYPKMVNTYVACGQVINFNEGFELILNEIKNLAEKANNKKDLYIIQSISDFKMNEDTILPANQKKVQKFSMLALKYIAPKTKNFPITKLLTSPFLNFKEKKITLLGKPTLQKELYKECGTYDFRNNMTYATPLIFINGKNDISCPAKLINDCFNNITALQKEIHILENAGHLCFFDSPNQFLNILRQFN